MRRRYIPLTNLLSPLLSFFNILLSFSFTSALLKISIYSSASRLRQCLFTAWIGKPLAFRFLEYLNFVIVSLFSSHFSLFLTFHLAMDCRSVCLCGAQNLHLLYVLLFFILAIPKHLPSNYHHVYFILNSLLFILILLFFLLLFFSFSGVAFHHLK